VWPLGSTPLQKEVFLVDVKNTLACQVYNVLRVPVLQWQGTDHIKRLENVEQIERYKKDRDLVFKTVLLEILVEMDLVAV
jgi:hypothetical protein